MADRVVEALVNENSLRVGVWIKTLKPARRHLIDPLGVVYRSEAKSRTQSQIDHATEILEEYAVDDLESLAELLVDAEPMQFMALFDEFAAHGIAARAKLSAELQRTLGHDWNDESLEPTWPQPAPDVAAKIEQAYGTLAERFAFCQTMAMEQFKVVVESLRKSGYRPTRVRPYAHQDSVHVAAAWTRDDRDWRLVTDKSSKAILAEDEKQRSDGFVAVDVAGYIGGASGAASELFAALWMKRQDESEDARLFAGILHADVQAIQDALKQSEYEFTQALQGFRGLKGQRKYCGVVWKNKGSSTLLLSQSPTSFDQTEYLDKISWDIDPGRARNLPTPRARNLTAFRAAEKILTDDSARLDARIARGKAHFNSGHDAKALDDFDFLINRHNSLVESDQDQADVPAEAYRYRAILHARMGRADEARQDLASFKQRSPSASEIASLEAIVSIHLDDDTGATQRLETFIDEHQENSESLYDAASAYAIASGIYREIEITRSKIYAERSVSLIRRAIEQGYTDFSHLQTDPDLDPIRDVKGFIDIMQASNVDLRYAAVWNNSTWLESRQSHGLAPLDHLAKCRDMQADGYRVASISTASINGELVTASVWHRPMIQDVDRETLARRQANAAVAALRMGDAEKIWPLLKQSPDPRLRTWIIHRLSPMGASPEMIVKRLRDESNVSIRRALILILGEYKLAAYGDAAQIDRETLSETLLGLYRSDPDAGIHAAAQWVLRRWGKTADLDEINLTSEPTALAAGLSWNLTSEPTALAAGLSWNTTRAASAVGSQKQHHDSRDWYLTKQGHTMVVIPGPVQFLMGSPYTQRERSAFEYLHRKRIGHSFAIASEEVTVGQFREFLRNSPEVKHRYTEKHAPEEDCPQTSVTWYEAAAYCRWLSEQEQIPEDQMCYPPIAEIKEGMTLPSDYLSRTGYRLPTEAEWEFACRAGAETSRYYGEADQLLGQYAWYVNTSDDRTWPVGSLKPNDLGLFDMQGNVQEWCQEQYLDYSRILGSVSEEREDMVTLKNSARRLLRGGSFGVRSSDVRSACRSFNRPPNRYSNSGFRVARTYHESP